MIIIDDVFNDLVIRKRIINAIKYYKVLQTYHLLTDEQRRDLFDIEEKRKNKRIYRGAYDLNALEADYIEAHGGNVDNEELLKFFFNMGRIYRTYNADSAIISFNKTNDITNYINAHIECADTYIYEIKRNISKLSSVFADDIKYPQWVLDIPVKEDDHDLTCFKQQITACNYLYKVDYKLIRNSGNEYLIECNLEKGKPVPKCFDVYFKYKNNIQRACFSNKGTAIECNWCCKLGCKSGTIRRTKTFESRIEGAIALIEQWIKEIEAKTKE